jgi:hypothetical protein
VKKKAVGDMHGRKSSRKANQQVLDDFVRESAKVVSFGVGANQAVHIANTWVHFHILERVV